MLDHESHCPSSAVYRAAKYNNGVRLFTLGRYKHVRAPGRPALYIVGGSSCNRGRVMGDLNVKPSIDPRYNYTENENAQFFRWIVGGTLTIAGALAGVLWFMLMGQITELKGSLSHISDSVYDMKGDIKLLTSRAGEQSDRISEMQGFLKKK